MALDNIGLRWEKKGTAIPSLKKKKKSLKGKGTESLYPKQRRGQIKKKILEELLKLIGWK